MTWLLKSPAYGDIVRVKLGQIYHYGIFVSKEEVIQFGLAPALRPLIKDSELQVCVSTVEEFLCGGFIEVENPDQTEQKKRKSPKETVLNAQKRLGEKGYHILYNNCEHFAYECAYGEKHCSQAEEVRKLFRSLPVLDVYIAPLPNGEISAVHPKERSEEIFSCKNERVRREKYFVWKLLAYALERSFGKKMDKLSFSKSENGKWKTDCGVEFSLSHSEGAVCVALSRMPVGVDIELIAPPKTEGIFEKIFTLTDWTAYASLASEKEKAGYFTRKWTEKEAIFKSLDLPSFLPALSRLNDRKSKTLEVVCNGKTYALSVAGESVEQFKLREVLSLK